MIIQIVANIWIEMKNYSMIIYISNIKDIHNIKDIRFKMKWFSELRKWKLNERDFFYSKEAVSIDFCLQDPTIYLSGVR